MSVATHTKFQKKVWKVNPQIHRILTGMTPLRQAINKEERTHKWKRYNFYWASKKKKILSSHRHILKAIPWPKLLAVSFIAWFIALTYSNL